MKMVLALILLAIFLSACKETPKPRLALPDELFGVDLILPDDIKDEKDASVLMLRLYEAYEKCKINLNTLKDLVNE